MAHITCFAQRMAHGKPQWRHIVPGICAPSKPLRLYHFRLTLLCCPFHFISLLQCICLQLILIVAWNMIQSLLVTEQLLVVWRGARIPATCWNCCQSSSGFSLPESCAARSTKRDCDTVSSKKFFLLLQKYCISLSFWEVVRLCRSPSCLLEMGSERWLGCPQGSLR